MIDYSYYTKNKLNITNSDNFEIISKILCAFKWKNKIYLMYSCLQTAIYLS